MKLPRSEYEVRFRDLLGDLPKYCSENSCATCFLSIGVCKDSNDEYLALCTILAKHFCVTE